MGIFEIGMIILTFILLISTIICGLWIHYSKKEIEQSSINFHIGTGILTAISTLFAVLLLI